MKKISFWAYHHLWAARLIIMLSWLLLTIMAAFLGDLLYSPSFSFSIITYYFLAAASLAGVILYPQKKDKKKYKNFYVLQKSCDAILAAATFLAIIVTSYEANRITHSFYPVNAAMSVAKPSGNTVKIKPDDISKKPLKSLRKSLKQNVTSLRAAYKNTTRGGKIALVALSVFVAAILLLAVITFACNLSCSGSATAALLLGFGGAAVIIFLLIRVIRRITKGKRIKNVKEPFSASV